MTLDIAVELVMAQFSEMKSMIETLRNDFNSKIDAIKSELQEKVDVLQAEVKILKTTCEAKFIKQDAEMNQLHHTMDQLNQNISAVENRKELIISGVPFTSNEDPNALFAMICRRLEFNAGDFRQASTRRIYARRMKDGDCSPLLVEFALKATRDEFYGTYLRRRDLKLRHLGIPSESRVFITENLTTTAREVKNAALSLKKTGKLASVLTKEGVVHVKRRVGDRPIAIYTVHDLDNV